MFYSELFYILFPFILFFLPKRRNCMASSVCLFCNFVFFYVYRNEWWAQSFSSVRIRGPGPVHCWHTDSRSGHV